MWMKYNDPVVPFQSFLDYIKASRQNVSVWKELHERSSESYIFIPPIYYSFFLQYFPSEYSKLSVTIRITLTSSSLCMFTFFISMIIHSLLHILFLFFFLFFASFLLSWFYILIPRDRHRDMDSLLNQICLTFDVCARIQKWWFFRGQISFAWRINILVVYFLWM